MPPSRISTSSRSRTVSLRGGSARRTTTRTRTSAPRYGYRRSAPSYYVARTTSRYGLSANRRMSSWTPSVTRAKINVPQFVMAQVDAFNHKVEGVKIPDMCSIPSATSFSREIQSPQINPQGFSMTAYRFQQSCTYVSGTPVTGTAAIWPTMGQSFTSGGVQQDPAYASMVQNYLDTRTVACGVRVQCNLPALTAQGFIHMAVVPEDMANSSTWQYPTTFAAMERAPYYQKVPLANLINNTPVISMPIMDEGAWRYRNTQLAPSQVGQQALQAVNSTTPVQVKVTGSGTTTSGQQTVTFPQVFVNIPTVTLSVPGVGATILGAETVGVSITSFTASIEQDPGGSGAIAPYNGNYAWEATGLMTPANALAYYTSIGAAMPVSANSQVSFTIPSIETTYGWGTVIIALENAGVAGSPIEVEIIRHYEAIPSDVVGSVITATRAQPNAPEVLSLAKNVQQESGCIDIVPSDKLGEEQPAVMRNIRKAAEYTAGISGAFSGLHPALAVISGAASTLSTVSRVYLTYDLPNSPQIL